MEKGLLRFLTPPRERIQKILLTMRLALTILFLCVWQAGANIYSQITVNLDIQDKPVREVLKSIEQQTHVRFFYSDDLLAMNNLIDVRAENKNIINVLDDMFLKSPLTYRAYENNLIVIVPRELLQQKQITGRVTDKDGVPLPGVNVLVTGTTLGTITDGNGNYSIDVPEDAKTLTFQFLGMKTQEITIGTSTRIDVVMIESIIGLDEIVVVGYGTQKKSDLTGAVISVSGDDLTARPVNNVFESMQGKAAGVDITTTIRPGTIGMINIRGVRSLTASNTPLYVVDGVPVLSSSTIETLNPQDIESIDILKDASATAIYGSRGANGVVLVTTKSGKSGAFTLDYSGTITSESLVWRSRYMNVEEYVDFIRWGAYNKAPTTLLPGNQPSLENDGKIELFTADPTAWSNIQKGWATGTWNPSALETYDWMGAVTQPNITHEHTLSGSGGTDKMRAYGSIGFLDNQGTTKGQEYQRYTVRTSVELKPKEWILFGAGVNSSWMYQDYGQANIGGSMTGFANDLIGSAAKIYPYALPYDDNGNLIAFPGGQSRVANVINEWEYSTNQRETLRVIGSLYGEVNLLKGLKYRINFGPDFVNYRNGIYNDGKSIVRGGSSYARLTGNRDFSWTLDNLLYYDNTFGAHTIGITLLQTASKRTNESFDLRGQGIATSSQKWYNLDALSSLEGWSSDLVESQLCSYMGRLNYNYANKYLLTFSGRWDGASMLAEGNKWSFFPSVALGWRLEQEEFMKNLTWIDQLKLRLGYGSTGNAAVTEYNTKGEISSIQTAFGGTVVNGYTTTLSVSNPKLGWEKTTQYNLGIDFSILRGRINGVIDAYASNTSDLIMTMALPSVSGYTSTLANVGKTKNKGLDVSLATVNIDTKGFVWDSRITASWQRDEIVELMNGKEDMVANNWFIGESIESVYTFERLGLWQDTPEDQEKMAAFNANGHVFQPGMVKVKDQNNDTIISPNHDRVVIGNTRPRWIVGLDNNFSFKNFELSVFIVGRLKYVTAVGEALTGMYGDQRVVDYWTPDNTDAEYQKPFRDEAGGDTYAMTYYKDDSYLKIRSIALAYNVPSSVASKMKVRNIKLYVQSRNPGMLWSNIKWRDAEYGTIYFNRGLVFGLNVGF